ncbi:complex I subunit 4 family protein [Frateuria defendens]|uniref:complex I subunit 4 family protein n=1 Tax=Frateuria defendens TaxID=2219559 RepID=UPI00066FF807|nr:NADH-quinone oxidoreductase subunit M [Frateuria defendens]
MSNYLLSLLTWVPVLCGVVLLIVRDRRPDLLRWITLLTAIAMFVVNISMWPMMDHANPGLQFVEHLSWGGPIHTAYALGVDGIAYAMTLLVTFGTMLVVAGSWGSISYKLHQYMACIMIMEGLMIGCFSATDALLFYVFFEGMLIPMFLLIGVWGGPRRIYAALKFFIYTFCGSILLLVSLIYLYTKAGTFDIRALAALPLSMTEQTWLFFAFLVAFAIKIPMVPVHTWLPDAHVEAPTGASVDLAMIMLKIGGYGMVRFMLPIAPDASAEYAWLIIVLSLVAVVYIGYVALVQEDMKRVMAYSSVAHMGFVTLGIFVAVALVHEGGSADTALLGMQGAMVQMLSHGFISGAMFTCVGMLYDRLHTRMIKDYGGVMNVMPWFGFFYVLFAMANSGLPGTSGFVGEFMVILASFAVSPWVALFAAITLVTGAAYTLWMVKRVLWGEIGNAHVAAMKDINLREAAVLAAFAGAVMVAGVWPRPFIDLMDASVSQLVHQIASPKI